MTNDRIGNIIASLTLEEKASLASGKSFWETQDIPAKGVPSIWLADGRTACARRTVCTSVRTAATA